MMRRKNSKNSLLVVGGASLVFTRIVSSAMIHDPLLEQLPSQKNIRILTLGVQ
jgi:hypothetical protein